MDRRLPSGLPNPTIGMATEVADAREWEMKSENKCLFSSSSIEQGGSSHGGFIFRQIKKIAPARMAKVQGIENCIGQVQQLFRAG